MGYEIEDITGQLTARTIRHVELLGLRRLEIQFKTNRNTEAVARPPCERNTHHAQHEV
jgi:hypothetical protein